MNSITPSHYTNNSTSTSFLMDSKLENYHFRKVSEQELEERKLHLDSEDEAKRFLDFMDCGSEELAESVVVNVPNKVHNPGFAGDIALKAIKYALRHHAQDIIKKLPSKYRGTFYKYSNKIVNVLDDFDEWKEGSIAIALVKAGIPYSDALLIAKAISLLI